MTITSKANGIRLYKKQDVCEMTGLSLRMLNKLIHQKAIRVCHPTPGTVRISEDSLREWITEIDGGRRDAA